MRINLLLHTIIITVVFASQLNALPTSQPLTHRRKPYENPKYVEGDIVFPESMLKPTSRGVLRRGTAVAWPNGIVPYQILPGYGPQQEAFIVHIMRKMERVIAINNVACIQFRPRIPSDTHYISIHNGEGCSSPVGQMTGEGINHTVSLEYPGCFLDGIIMHELLHTLGFWHEQSRPDRDDYVRINFDNIDPQMAFNFDKYDHSLVNMQNTPYDYASVMHYEPDAFSKNNLPTIEAVQENVTFGQRYNMSTIDIQEARLFYNCSSSGVTLPPMPTTTTANLHVMNTTLSGSLTTNSEAFHHFNGKSNTHYYELFEVIVPVAGDYILKSDSSLDTYGILYKENFYQNSPAINGYLSDNDGGENLQFKMKGYLKSNTRYVLIITTNTPTTTGDFTIIVSGLNRVNLRQINSSSIISTTTTTDAPSIELVMSSYASGLTENCSVYDRYGGSGKYYYEAIKISVPETGYYFIGSFSNMDTFGYLYSNSFNPSKVEENLITGDDDTAEKAQFLVQALFTKGKTYILVVTTHDEMVHGPFIIFSYGHKKVKFSSVTDLPSGSMKFNIIPIHFMNSVIFGFILRYFITA